MIWRLSVVILLLLLLVIIDAVIILWGVNKVFPFLLSAFLSLQSCRIRLLLKLRFKRVLRGGNFEA